MTRLIDNRVKTDITDKVFLGGGFLHRVSNLCDYSCDSDFSKTWNREEDMVWIISIHKLFDFSLELFDLFVKLEVLSAVH